MKNRIPDYAVSDLFINRWSPRAMSGQELTDQELMSLFEAARWAPSSYNNQPWHFVYAKRNTPHWHTLYNLLDDFNKTWNTKTAVLVVVISRNTFTYNNKPSRTHSYDTGAAWIALGLQAYLNHIVAHGMEGFDYDRAKKELNIPDGYTVEAMIALGKLGNIEDLPPELQKKEVPSTRKHVSEFVFEGNFLDQCK
jgi:hypothetical protein